jgi:DNA invertase Pin-like site-specific DNA recombinase
MMNDKKPAGSRGFVYLRISSNKQDVRSQRQAIQTYLDRHGIVPIRFYEDVGSRDLAFKRQDFLKMMAAVRAGEADFVLAEALDRIGVRDAADYGRLICEFRDSDCELWSVQQGHLTAGDIGTSVLGAVHAEQSRAEQLDKAGRSLRGKVAAVARGEWAGGSPPYGYDLACVGPDGKERWRLYYTGRWQRQRIWPAATGRPPERFDGKGNVPGRDPGEVLRLVPSCDERRVEMARKIYYWMASEAISLRKLCDRLNRLGISPVIGDGWYTTRLRQWLSNPAMVTGRTCWNKRGHGRHLELLGGQAQPVPRRKGRAIAGRQRASTDYVQAEGEDQGIIDRETWDAVQAKLAGIRTPGKSPRNPALFLAPLLYCGHCGCRMSGWCHPGPKTKGCPLSYTCSTYKRYGKSNPSGCRLHCVNHQIIQALVERFLAETGKKLALLDSISSEDELLAQMETAADKVQLDFLRTLGQLWQEVKRSGAVLPQGTPWTVATLGRAYQATADQHRQELQQRLDEKRQELDGLLLAAAKLTSEVALQRMAQLTEVLGQEIGQLEAELVPLDERLQGQRDELQRLQRSLADAREALAGDSNRRKTQALSQVVARVVCFFEHRQAKSQARSILREVRIEPLLGESKTYATTTSP